MGESFENFGPRWYIIHTYSGYENKVKANIEKIVENRNLQNVIQEIRVPTQTVGIKTENGIKETDEKIYPSYVLVKMEMSDKNWHIVRNISGVTGFVGPGSKPVPLSDEEVNEMGIEVHRIELDFAVGDGVKIKSGFLTGNIGIVKSISDDNKKVQVLASMFGRETPIDLDAMDLEKLVL